jgi:catechol 2,3-dioxygenase-like lactoylglutathione lyase family enzyme
MIEVTTMLSEFLAVTTLVVTDVDQAKPFYEEQLGLTLLDEIPAGCRFGAGKGSQLTIRRGLPPTGGLTVAHFEVDDIEAVVRDLTSRRVVPPHPRPRPGSRLDPIAAGTWLLAWNAPIAQPRSTPPWAP